LKKWYGKRTQKDFQRKIKGIMMNWNTILLLIIKNLFNIT
jgi:hypothetical protein